MSTIVIDARELRTSTGRYIERLLHYLQEIDHKNNYQVLLKAKDFDGWVPTNKKFEKLISPYKEFTFGEQLGLLVQLKKLKPDLVHFGMVQQPILYNGNVVTTMQDLTTTRFKNPAKNWLVFNIKQFVYVWVNRIVAHKSTRVIVPSQFVKEDVARFTRINSRKIVVTYEGADKITEVAEPIEELIDCKFIMYVGRALPHKNLKRLVSAFSLLKQTHPELKLVLAGKRDSLYKELARWVEEQEVPDVVFTGFISEGKLRWLYENCQLYTFPSLSEGFGLPGLEAMRAGAAVVASNVTSLPEVYGDAAQYFDPYVIEDMKDTLDKVLSNKQLRDRLIANGHDQVKRYSWREMAEQTLRVYEEALGEPVTT